MCNMVEKKAKKGAVRTVVIANKVKQSSIVFAGSLQKKAQYLALPSFYNSRLLKKDSHVAALLLRNLFGGGQF